MLKYMRTHMAWSERPARAVWSLETGRIASMPQCVSPAVPLLPIVPVENFARCGAFRAAQFGSRGLDAGIRQPRHQLVARTRPHVHGEAKRTNILSAERA